MYSYVSEGTCVLSGRQPEPFRDYGRGSTSPPTARARGAEQLPAGVLLLSLPRAPVAGPPRRGPPGRGRRSECTARCGAPVALTSNRARACTGHRCGREVAWAPSPPPSTASSGGRGPSPRLQRRRRPLQGGQRRVASAWHRPRGGSSGSVPLSGRRGPYWVSDCLATFLLVTGLDRGRWAFPAAAAPATTPQGWPGAFSTGWAPSARRQRRLGTPRGAPVTTLGATDPVA